jgi:hypothetical protein
MRRVLVFNNFQTTAKTYSENDGTNVYVRVGPGRFQSNPYSKTKHISFPDLLKRVLAALRLTTVSLRYDVLAVDSAITAMLVACMLPPIFRPKLIVTSFNVPRRRNGWAKIVGFLLFRRVDHFVVHSQYDIELAANLYRIDKGRFTFMNYRREALNDEGTPLEFKEANRGEFILSIGGNARDYHTLCQAVVDLPVRLVVVAREYNLVGVNIPKNVSVYTNIPLAYCDWLVKRSQFTVMAFDGSEPSCGQISVVSSLMAGRPVICTDCTAMRDYIEPMRNGLLVEPRDVKSLRQAIVRLRDDVELCKSLSVGALEWTEAKVAIPWERQMDQVIMKLWK